MTTFLTICLTIIVIALLLLAALLIFPKNSAGTVSVHLDDKNSGVRIVQSNDGLHLDIIYETYEEREEDPGLFPDIVNDVAPKNDADRDFWLAVASLNELSVEEREKVVMKLRAFGFLSADKGLEFVLPSDNREEDEAPDPAEADPADKAAFDRAYPKEEDADDNFEEFNI